jgi:hypothetical protein
MNYRVKRKRTIQLDSDFGAVAPSLRLVPPLHESFTVPGTAETVDRARKWALHNEVLKAENVSPCAHGLYLFSMCPGPSSCCPTLDHTSVWVPNRSKGGDPGRPFLLTMPYTGDEAVAELGAYARAHGLDLDHADDDNWYGWGTAAYRMTIPPSWPAWPIDIQASTIMSMLPTRWPEGDELDDLIGPLHNGRPWLPGVSS